ncbi:MAG TPA: hypothetical protein VKV22_03830 [Rhodanobacteraceae bacterium]|nr:hypothetical protein [Rhodanobacteraceae bacterium]
MKAPSSLLILAAGLLAAPAFAQTTGSPLNLQLPPGDMPAVASTATKPARPDPAAGPATASTAVVSGHAAPGVYYGDTSGRTYKTAETRVPTCDDSTYNQAQMHGSVTTGVYSAGHRGSGSWGGATVDISKAFGSCEHPTGGVSITIGGGSGRFHGH